MGKTLIINVEREGYALSQVRSTMTVGDLIEFLSNFDEDRLVYIGHDNHYTFSGIHEEDVEADYEEEE